MYMVCLLTTVTKGTQQDTTLRHMKLYELCKQNVYDVIPVNITVIRIREISLNTIIIHIRRDTTKYHQREVTLQREVTSHREVTSNPFKITTHIGVN